MTGASWLERFDSIASRVPTDLAVISGGTRLTYGELAARSDAAARHLMDLGIGRGTFAGLGLPRCPQLPVALLGILKTGAAYIPLDPAYPTARIGHMIESASIRHVVTTSEFAGAFPNATTILLDTLPPLPASAPLPSPPAAGDFIYAIFTSGSTGQPKAATVRHGGFANLLDWYASEMALTPDDRTLVISSPSFDLTQKNFYAPLLSGGTLVLDDQPVYDIPRIIALIREHRVTIVNCTPSAFYPIIDAAASDGFQSISSLRFAVLGGEPISIPRLRSWLEHPSCRAEVMNSYGPTECTDICAFHRLHRGNLDQFSFVPLGREIPDVRVTIRNENLEPLPENETGELCIEGAGVGGGYLNDAQRTAERFPNGLYRTGDLAKRLPCGVLEFRGRADHQVKINGFRIELGEIEIALNRHASVREAVVIADGNKLVAHVQGTADESSLRSHLSGILPSYMIPGEFRFVESFPLTPNGKIDRLAISRTTGSAPPVSKNSSGTLESGILQLWSELLGRGISDPEANFFDLGGNSIHLAVVHVRLQEMTGRTFPITELFARPSARTLSDFFHPSTAAASGFRERALLTRKGFSRFSRPNTK